MTDSPMEPRATEPAQSDKEQRRPRIHGWRLARERRWSGPAASLLLHALVILLLFMPQSTFKPFDNHEGAGGPGPAGGGGGHRGTGGVPERIQYFAAAPAPAPTPIPVPTLKPVVQEKKPEVPPPPVPVPEATKVDTATKAATASDVTSKVAGVGGGSGDDGSNGSGPGRGGGVGSGVGTGRGSSVGPGTGGGNGTVYPPTVTTLVILPLPVPAKVKPYEMTACFDVDSTGKATLRDFTKSKDNDYNKKVHESLLGYRFRPAVRYDGTPVRDSTCVKARGG